MDFFNPSKVASELTSVQFEQLLRFYIKQHIENSGLRTKNTSGKSYISYVSFYYFPESGKTEWTLNSMKNYISNPVKSEQLAFTFDEARRREEFVEQTKLMQITHEVDATPTDDNIPF